MNTDETARRIIAVHDRAVEAYVKHLRDRPDMSKAEVLARGQEVQSVLYNEIVKALEEQKAIIDNVGSLLQRRAAAVEDEAPAPKPSKKESQWPEVLEFRAGKNGDGVRRSIPRKLFSDTWKKNDYNNTKTAAEFNIHEDTFRSLRDKFGLRPPWERYTPAQIEDAWRKSRYVTTHAAKSLSLTTRRFKILLEKHNIKKPWEREEEPAVRLPENNQQT